ncbi:MAG: AmiR/NasT family two-component response regulator [Kiritimatiellia bacterium]|jgi:AmiR/NasT family two-component response regulator
MKADKIETLSILDSDERIPGLRSDLQDAGYQDTGAVTFSIPEALTALAQNTCDLLVLDLTFERADEISANLEPISTRYDGPVAIFIDQA